MKTFMLTDVLLQRPMYVAMGQGLVRDGTLMNVGNEFAGAEMRDDGLEWTNNQNCRRWLGIYGHEPGCFPSHISDSPDITFTSKSQSTIK